MAGNTRFDGLLCTVEHYAEPDPQHPVAHAQFERRLQRLREDVEPYATVVMDSLSSYQNCALNRQRYVLDPIRGGGQTTNRNWYNAVTLDATMLMQRLAFIRRRNIIVIAHSSEKTVGEFGDHVLRGVASYGQLGKQLPQSYSEVYRFEVARDDEDAVRIQMVTRSDEKWVAGSTIPAPNPCEPSYQALWPEGVKPRWINVLAYGPPHHAKSLFASTFPTPILVLAFDPPPKLWAYEALGETRKDLKWDFNDKALPPFEITDIYT